MELTFDSHKFPSIPLGAIQEGVAKGANFVLGTKGTKEHPREVTIPWAGRMPILIVKHSPDEPITKWMQSHGRTLRRYRSPGSKRQDVTLIWETNVWYHDRFQQETRVVYIDRSANYYLEFLKQETGDVTWWNEELLSDHAAGGVRQPGMRLGRWPALAHISPIEKPPVHNSPPTLTNQGITFRYEPGCVLLIPGPDGLPWAFWKPGPDSIQRER